MAFFHMLDHLQAMSPARRFPLAVLALALAPAAARADDNMLRGPFPFLKENDISAHVLLANGLGDAPSGTEVSLHYGYQFGRPGFPRPGWVALELNLQRGTCRAQPGGTVCGPSTGDAYETMGGVGWRWPTAIPVVPFANLTAGMVFVFPNGATSAMGIVSRASGGANYYFFDWLGAGAEVGVSLGHVFYDSTFPGASTYSVVDVGGGIQVLF
jgi:hypothetical protein